MWWKITASWRVCCCRFYWGYQFVPTFRQAFRFLASNFFGYCHTCRHFQRTSSFFLQYLSLRSAGYHLSFKVSGLYGSVCTYRHYTSYLHITSLHFSRGKKGSEKQDLAFSPLYFVAKIFFCPAFLFGFLENSTGWRPRTSGPLSFNTVQYRLAWWFKKQ